jgi:hypothetical protein
LELPPTLTLPSTFPPQASGTRCLLGRHGPHHRPVPRRARPSQLRVTASPTAYAYCTWCQSIRAEHNRTRPTPTPTATDPWPPSGHSSCQCLHAWFSPAALFALPPNAPVGFPTAAPKALRPHTSDELSTTICRQQQLPIGCALTSRTISVSTRQSLTGTGTALGDKTIPPISLLATQPHDRPSPARYIKTTTPPLLDPTAAPLAILFLILADPFSRVRRLRCRF